MITQEAVFCHERRISLSMRLCADLPLPQTLIWNVTNCLPVSVQQLLHIQCWPIPWIVLSVP